jgi:hypothetical protein
LTAENLNANVLFYFTFEFWRHLQPEVKQVEKVKSEKEINMADVYTGERDCVNFITFL